MGARGGAGLRAIPAPQAVELASAVASSTAAWTSAPQVLPTVPALADLFPDRGLRRGASYSVTGSAGSTTLALAMLATASSAGSWCGVVGVPTLGVTAAAELGIDLDRLALVPHPGDSWLEAVAALVDAADIVLVRPPAGSAATTGPAVTRLAARVRKRGAVLVVLGQWPGCALRLTVTSNEWVGLGSGHGRLLARRATVATTGRGGAARPRTTTLWLPDENCAVRELTPGILDDDQTTRAG